MGFTDRTTRWFRHPLLLWSFVLAWMLIGIAVATWHSPEEAEREALAVRGRPPDVALRANVVSTLREQAGDLGELRVEAHDGVVTLEGWVETPSDRAAALRIARSTPGVREVVTRLQVRSGGVGGGEGDEPPASPGTAPESGGSG